MNEPFPGPFSHISLKYSFLIQLIVNNIADDLIWTVDLWRHKHPLYQLRHNHSPQKYIFCKPENFRWMKATMDSEKKSLHDSKSPPAPANRRAAKHPVTSSPCHVTLTACFATSSLYRKTWEAFHTTSTSFHVTPTALWSGPGLKRPAAMTLFRCSSSIGSATIWGRRQSCPDNRNRGPKTFAEDSSERIKSC